METTGTAPELRPGDSGVRAQTLDPDGTLADDFRIVEGPNAMHVLQCFISCGNRLSCHWRMAGE